MPPPGHKFYYPEEFYFVDTGGFPGMEAVRVTARRLVAWADRYVAFCISPSTPQERTGALPENGPDRVELVDGVFDWFRANYDPTDPAPEFAQFGLVLLRGDTKILDAHDGLPGTLELAEAEFRWLQDHWRHHNLPVDLYYPSESGRIAVDAVETDAEVVRVAQWYSPLRWSHRGRAGPGPRR